MATFTSDVASQGQFFEGQGGYVQVRKVTYNITAALAASDVIQMVPVQPGEQCVGGWIITPDLDTNGSPTITFDVGDGDDVDRYVDGSAVPQTGGVIAWGAGVAASAAAATAFNKVYTAADTLDITVSAAVATGATSGAITMIALIVGS